MPKDRRIEVDSRREILRRQPPRRHQKVDGAPQGSHIPSVAPLKSKIHDLTRALQHNERMPADVRVEKERALAGYRKDLENAEKEKQKQLLIKRYHMVRFFERQKAERHVKKAQKAVEASSPDQPDYRQLQQNLHVANVDVCYAIYYPLTEKYVSLYPRKNGNDYSKGCETSVEKKPDMWEIVRKNMAEGTLDALREGTSTTLSNAGMNRRAITARAPKPKYNSKSVEFGSKSIKTEEQDEESDGGFFEEGSDGGGVP